MLTLTKVVEDLKTNLDMYLADALKNAREGIEPSENEWVGQIADIHEAAYGEPLELDQLSVE